MKQETGVLAAMRLAVSTAGLSLIVFAATPAHAADAVDAARATVLSNSNACMGCHQVKRKMVGPSFDDVTARYKADPDAVAKIGVKIIKGGAGAWGMIPMPSHPAMSKTDAQTIAAWIMAGSPSAK
jgi:cytochrome c